MNRSMFKLFISTAMLLFALTLTSAEKRARYVFLFVGDGMGENIRKYYQYEYPDSSLEKFPVTVRTGTNNCSDSVTDSAASGTAIACGIKTYNGAIGVTAQHRPVTSLAKILHEKGCSIGIITSVGLNDATPSAHYANRISRKDRAGILSDLYASNFDFFAGGFLALPKGGKIKAYSKLLGQVGYKFFDHFDFTGKTPSNRVVFVHSMEPDWPGEKQSRHLLSEVTEFAAKSLSANKNGFFMLVEGGAIDHRAHNNDLAGVMREMREFDLAVKTALEFQKQHPDETLIVITSDHDTGGMDIGEYKKGSLWKKQLHRAVNADKEVAQSIKKLSDEEIINNLAAYFGMMPLSNDEKKAMLEALKCYRDPQLRKKNKFRSMYGKYNPAVVQMMRLRDKRCGITWTSFSHTTCKVLTNAQGAGAEYFRSVKENSDIPRAISRAMLGEDVMDKAAATLPLPVEKNTEEYFNFITLTPDKAVFRYGQKNLGELEFIFQGNGKKEVLIGSDRAGRLTFEKLVPGSIYSMLVKRSGKVIAQRRIKTLPAAAGKLISRFAVIADPHLSLFPDVRFGRLHSKSVETLDKAFEHFAEEKVDFIALPGDVTDASKQYELLAAGKAVEKYKNMRFLAVPGNHDLMNSSKFKAQWIKIFGKTARVEKYGKLQILLLDTWNGRLADKAENIQAIEALDSSLPVLVFSHYQLTPDAYIKDKAKAIYDADKAHAVLKKLSAMKGAIIVGHKNVATSARLGNLLQINAPQLTQFPAGTLYCELYSNGLRLEFRPMLDVFYDEYSRIRGNAMKQKAAARDKNSLNVWNAFYPMDLAAGL